MFDIMIGRIVEERKESDLQGILRIISIILIVVSCIIVGVFYIVTTNSIEEIYARDTEHSIYELKQDFLRDTVNNQIKRIDTRRELGIQQYSQVLQKTTKMLADAKSSSTDGEFVRIFSNHFALCSETGDWSAVLWDSESGEVLFDSDGFFTHGEASPIALADMDELFAVYAKPSFGRFRSFYGVRKDKIDSAVKQEIADEIHNSAFAEDSYIWVNEVIDYNGGENYAIRRIHPNLRDTEGVFLSTTVTDIAGNLPYLEELEGVKRDGEIFFTYYFKRKDSDEIAQKLTYAKLYEDFDWIVAMGVHLPDMETYIDTANQKSADVTGRWLPIFLVMLVLLVAGGSVLILIVERWKTKRGRRVLEQQANQDVLTQAYNRRMGLHDLSRIFHAFTKDTEISPAIIVFDIDDFKLVNDTYGHARGDDALKMVSSSILSSIRSTDRLYRWGGDEFMLLCEGVQRQYIEVFCQNLLERFSDLMSQSDQAELALTLSMGASYFHKEDAAYQEALERADGALYRAKRNGKNRVELEL